MRNLWTIIGNKRHTAVVEMLWHICTAEHDQIYSTHTHTQPDRLPHSVRELYICRVGFNLRHKWLELSRFGDIIATAKDVATKKKKKDVATLSRAELLFIHSLLPPGRCHLLSRIYACYCCCYLNLNYISSSFGQPAIIYGLCFSVV